MKKSSSLAVIALLAMTLGHQALADVVVDTGTPDQKGFSVELSSGQWLAAEFTTTQEWRLSTINGYINGFDDNQIGTTFTVSVYDNSAKNTPDLSSPELSQQATFAGNGWNGLSGLNLDLMAGSYWVAFEVGSADTLQGLLPVSSANPLSNTALYDGVSIGGYKATSAAYPLGVQISSVPVPPGLVLFVSGLLAMGRLGKRKSI